MGQSVRKEMFKMGLTMNRSSELKTLLSLMKLPFFCNNKKTILKQYSRTELACIEYCPLYHTYIGKSPLE